VQATDENSKLGRVALRDKKLDLQEENMMEQIKRVELSNDEA